VTANPCILDYGSGNVRSVSNLLSTLGCQVSISASSEAIDRASHLILPGVGAFAACVQGVRSRLPMEALLRNLFDLKKPFLGICVGMQVLSSLGREFEDHPGLDWIPGCVDRLDASGLPLPHVGWNDLQVVHDDPLLEGLDGADFYFVHSYVFRPDEPVRVRATTTYGTTFTAAIRQDNLWGVQFHPEKSQSAGRRLLTNFLEGCR